MSRPTATHVADVPARHINIYIAGPLQTIEDCCARFCTQGLCVSVTPTKFVYTGGRESGAIVGLINYARFPKNRTELDNIARDLAAHLMRDCCQRSCTIEDPELSEMLNNPDMPPRP